MKASILQLVTSGVALGLMAGAVGLHWHEVRKGGPLAEADPFSGGFTRVLSDTAPLPVHTVGNEEQAGGAVREGVAQSKEEMGATVEALNEIVSVLRELKDENRHLREQVKEANRDLTEMQFRIDTHSKSFRPLKVSNERAVPLKTESSSHPLLPPKRR